MARDDDDDDSLPPLGESTDKFLDQAKKGQSRNFLLVCKGNKVKYLAVRKKPIKKNELNEAVFARKKQHRIASCFEIGHNKLEGLFLVNIHQSFSSSIAKDD